MENVSPNPFRKMYTLLSIEKLVPKEQFLLYSNDGELSDLCFISLIRRPANLRVLYISTYAYVVG